MVEALKFKQLKTQKRKIAYALEEELFKAIEGSKDIKRLKFTDTQKDFMFKLSLEIAKEGMERLGLLWK